MRTTIELPDELISILHSEAVRKGYRGYSRVVQDALRFYFNYDRERENSRGKILKMRGSWSKKEAREMRERLEEVREGWKV